MQTTLQSQSIFFINFTYINNSRIFAQKVSIENITNLIIS